MVGRGKALLADELDQLCCQPRDETHASHAMLRSSNPDVREQTRSWMPSTLQIHRQNAVGDGALKASA